MEYLGTHIILELHGAEAKKLSDPAMIESIIREAADKAGATIIQSWSHHFAPLGVSAVLIISESHITIHTWPENEYAAVDIFYCGDIDAQKAIDHLVESLEAKDHESKIIKRGHVTSEK